MTSMRSVLGITGILTMGLSAIWGIQIQAEEKPSEEKPEVRHTVIQVMNGAMKKGQWKKLATGEATPEQATKLLALFDDLRANKAPHGDAVSWEEKTQEILEAAQAAAKKETGAGDRLKKAIDCRSCHQAHKE